MKTVFDNGGYVGVYADIKEPTFYSVPTFTTGNLVLSLDAGNKFSYSGTGSTWKDTSPLLQTATLNNTTYSATAGGGSFNFNGSTSSVTVPNNTSMDSQSLTLEVWTRTSNLNQNGFWMEKGNVNTQYSFFIYGGYIYWRIINVTDVTAVVSTFLTTNTWFHMVGTHTSGSQKLYRNGTEIASGTATGTVPTNNQGFSIGNANGAVSPSSYPYSGDIAIVRVYNRALTSNEVVLNYNNYKSRFGL